MSKTFEEPYFELFLWSVFTGRLSLVEFFWQRIPGPLIGSVIAASIYAKLALFYKTERQSSIEVLISQKQQFQDKCNKVCVCISLSR